MRITDFINSYTEESEKKGLYYYVNQRKKAGTSRSKNNPKAPSAQDWKNAAKTAKNESISDRELFSNRRTSPHDEPANPVASSIVRRIMLQRPDLLSHGPEAVGNAVDEVAEFVGDVEEIGSSDVSGWVRQVERILQSNQGVAEGFDGEDLANEVYAEFERMYPNLARRAHERTVHAAIIDVLNYGGDNNPSALAQDVARAVERDIEQGVAEGGPYDLPGIDYPRSGDTPRKKPSGDDEPNPYPYSPEEDDDYFREIFRKKRLAAAKAKEQGVAEGDDEFSNKDTTKGIHRPVPAKFKDLGNDEGIVLLGAGGELNDWIEGIFDIWQQEGITTAQYPNEVFDDAKVLTTSGGRTDLALTFKPGAPLDMGRMAMWRISFGDCSWISDYKTNYRKQHVAESDEFAPSQRAKTEIAASGWRRGGEVTGTSLKGYINATYDQLYSTFGDPVIGPNDVDGDKVTCEWVITFKDGKVATIYDWKTGGTPKDLHRWHIGGHDTDTVDRIGALLKGQGDLSHWDLGEGRAGLFVDGELKRVFESRAIAEKLLPNARTWFPDQLVEIKSLAEDATGGASCSSSIGAVVTELGGMTKRQVNSKLSKYTNIARKPKPVRVKGGY